MPITYKCPSCGAAMEFDSTSQMLACPQCGKQIGMDEYKDIYNSDEKQESDTQQATEESYNQDNSDASTQGRNFNQGNMKIYQMCGEYMYF